MFGAPLLHSPLGTSSWRLRVIIGQILITIVLIMVLLIVRRVSGNNNNYTGISMICL